MKSALDCAHLQRTRLMPEKARHLSVRRGVACISEVGLELGPPGARLVGHARVVVEVDTADNADLVGDVATEERRLVLAGGPVVAEPQPASDQGLAAKLGGLVEEEIDRAA